MDPAEAETTAWTRDRARVDEALVGLLDAGLDAEEPAVSEPIRDAVLAPGKRIRPLLLMAAYRTAGGRSASIAELACSVELVHAYSLIHDDLPCMDDDVLRRGRPTLHVSYGVEVATLAGAALMPLAVEAICAAAGRLDLPPEAERALTRELARAAGAAGMVGGQLLDLRAEGRQIDIEELERIHRGKTARLIEASTVMGGLAAGATDPVLSRLRGFGRRLGLAFQVVDDILDLTGDVTEMGKPEGRDAALGKATSPSVLGMERAVRRGRALADEAMAELAGLPDAGELRAITALVVERRN